MQDMPRTRADGAVRHFIRSSIPEGLAVRTRELKSSHAVYSFIMSLYKGGSNWEQNEIWLDELLNKKMQPGQLFPERIEESIRSRICTGSNSSKHLGTFVHSG
jgi:hypothetical protein